MDDKKLRDEELTQATGGVRPPNADNLTGFCPHCGKETLQGTPIGGGAKICTECKKEV